MTAFSDLPFDCIEEVVRAMMSKDGTWRNLYTAIQCSRDIRQCVASVLSSPFHKWNDLMIDRGKVRLDRLLVACSFPCLRSKAMRFVEGKSKFVYKNILYQLNHPREISSLHIIADNNACTMHWTNEDNAYVGNNSSKYLEAYGASIRHTPRHYRLWEHSFLKVHVDDVQNGFTFLCKLKASVAPNAMKEEMLSMLGQVKTMHGHVRKNNTFYWGTKHKRWNQEVDETTLLTHIA